MNRVSQRIPLVNLTTGDAYLPECVRGLGAFRIALPDGATPVIQGAYAVAAAFFGLDTAQKEPLDARRGGHVRGWTLARGKDKAPVGATPPEKPRDYEAFDVAVKRAGEIADPAGRKLFDTDNDWPSDGLRDAYERLLDTVYAPVEPLVWTALERTAGLPRGYFAQLSEDGGLNYLRFLTYPATDPSSRHLGFYAHKDYETFAIHVESRAGIEIWDKRSETWLNVELHDSEALVMVGELAEELSGGRLPAALHRVSVPPSPEPRHAIVYFSAPAFSAPLRHGRPDAPEGETVGRRLIQRFARSFGIQADFEQEEL